MDFDPAKDAANREKHHISLAEAERMTIVVAKPDNRFTGEQRHRAWGYIDGAAYCLAFTFRNGAIRPISLRRAHAKEMRRHLP